MIVINIFQPPPPLTIGIIISENVDNYGRPLICQMMIILLLRGGRSESYDSYHHG